MILRFLPFNPLSEACFPYRDGLLDLIGAKAKGTALNAAVEKVNMKEPCFLMEWAMRPLGFAKLNKDFFIFTARLFMPLLKFFNLFYKKDIFISPPFHARVMVYYLSKRSKRMNRQVRRVFNHFVNIVLENGFATKSEIDFRQVIDENYPSVKSTFHTVQDYIDHYTHQIEAVTMDDFR